MDMYNEASKSSMYPYFYFNNNSKSESKENPKKFPKLFVAKYFDRIIKQISVKVNERNKHSDRACISSNLLFAHAESKARHDRRCARPDNCEQLVDAERYVDDASMVSDLRRSAGTSALTISGARREKGK